MRTGTTPIFFGNKLGAEAIKFAIVGLANFVVTFLVFTGLLKLAQANYLVALGAAWVMGVIFSYIANFMWVFKAESSLRFNLRFMKFVFTGLMSVTLNAVVLGYLVEAMQLDPFNAQLILVPFLMVVNFLAAKCWSMRPLNKPKKRW